MKPSMTNLSAFVGNQNVQFSIPMYQRNYVWERINCEQMLEDIEVLARDTNKTHHFGMITFIQHSKNDAHGNMEFVIVDGQQRITTTMLLLKAIHGETKDAIIKQKIENMLKDQNKMRLKPIESDRKAYEALMNDQPTSDYMQSDIIKNYNFFRNAIKKDNEILERIYGALARVDLFGICLENGIDDPQVIFERINATGVRLKGIDLIRNYLMMCKNSDEQARLYENYWKPMEEYTEMEKHTESFIVTYLRIYYGASVKEKDERALYKKFKSHHRDRFEEDTEKLMQEMCNYGRIYQIFLKKKFKFANTPATLKQMEQLKQRIHTIVDIGFGVSYPLVMRLINDFEKGVLDFDNFDAMLATLISYYVRRNIYRLGTEALNDIIYPLYSNLIESGNLSNTRMQRILGEKMGRETFPSDMQIKESFLTWTAYSKGKNFITRLVLIEIEKKINKDGFDESKATIEHFYPQTPTKEWRALVGEEYEILENMYLHTIGNLSLTGQNGTLGNKPFFEKIEIFLEHGSLKLNEYFTNMDTWGIEQIKERARYLAERFCEVEIFKDLPKEYRKRAVFKTLSDDLTHFYFNRLFLPNGQGHNVKILKDLAQIIVDYLYQYHRGVVEEATDENLGYIEFDEKKAKFRDKDGILVVKCEKGGFWFISSASARDTGKNLAHFIESCRLNPQDFILEN
ncbi:DUF262 domain-containing protein [Helicobacter sp. MIT 05-5293]|uniref:DUF262 domain-containing protein n=1 Tax=Helicobacter sp. MIT 05-5293 TaxID=1548149 RepID=UPI00051D6C2D|nr:DUF262 domain-containing protein [Helicobacter sp. MIT 05-5293]TLD79796.1 DUF262 domain-containing protein [Helicobacter sp. MIT 05-5293]